MHKFSREIQFRILVFVSGVLIAGALALAISGTTAPSIQTKNAAVINVASPFLYSFSVPDTLNEQGSITESTSPYWWVNSGGELVLKGGVGETMQGDAPVSNLWRTEYSASNPTDTDNGLHPQNLFRLVTRSQWDDVQEQAQFYINADHFSSSPNHNASNGLLLMSRYQLGGQTLYYAGIRVDGTAVIKKKYKGTYYTMAQTKIFPGTYTGSIDNKNLIPHGEWIGLRSDTVTNSGGTVTVTLSMQLPGGAWTQLLKATDTGKNFGATPITSTGYAGIRTDFMDVKFESYRLQNI